MPKPRAAISKEEYFAHNHRSALIVLKDIDSVKEHANNAGYKYRDKPSRILALQELIAQYSLKVRERSGILKSATPELLHQSTSTFWRRNHVPRKAPESHHLWTVGTSEVSAGFIATMEHAHDLLVVKENYKLYEPPTKFTLHPSAEDMKQDLTGKSESIVSVEELVARKSPRVAESPIPPMPSELSFVDTAWNERQVTTRSKQRRETTLCPLSRYHGSRRSSVRIKKGSLSTSAKVSPFKPLRSGKTKSLQTRKGTASANEARNVQTWLNTVAPTTSSTLESCVSETPPSRVNTQLNGSRSQSAVVADQVPLESAHAIHSMMEKSLYRLDSIARKLSSALRLQDTAEARFDTYPTDDLCQLYRSCFGHDWRDSVNTLCSKRSRLLVDDVVIALVNAYIHNHIFTLPVFKVPLPPSIQESFNEELNQLLRPTGLEWGVVVETALSNTLANILEDSAEMSSWSDTHAQKLYCILQPHIRQNMYVYGPEFVSDWHTEFETGLRQVLAESLAIWRGFTLSGRNMKAFWPENCAQMDYNNMKARYSQPGTPAAEFKVAFAIQSGLKLAKDQTDGTSEQLVFYKAEVVMQSENLRA